MKIGIIGGGAVGLLLGSYFSVEYDVTIYTKSARQAKTLNEIGIHITRHGKEFTRIVKADEQYRRLDDQNLLIVAVKQYDLKSLLPVLKKVPTNIPLLFIQNGMDHLQLMDELHQFKTIFIGTVEHGVQRLTERSISHTGVGKLNIGLFRGELDQLSLFPIVEDEHFPIDFQSKLIDMLQKKLIANALINPLTAIFNVQNGRLLSNPYYYEVFTKLYSEVSSLFPEHHANGILQDVESICESTKDNVSSMLKDIKEGRKTEIDAILGYIIKQGDLNGYPMPLTNIIYDIIKGMEMERSLRG